MTIVEVQRAVANMTTDSSGHLARYAFRQAGVIGHVEANLNTDDGPSPEYWRIVWTVHWRTELGQEQRDSSTDLPALMARFGSVKLEVSHARTLDDLLK